MAGTSVRAFKKVSGFMMFHARDADVAAHSEDSDEVGGHREGRQPSHPKARQASVFAEYGEPGYIL